MKTVREQMKAGRYRRHPQRRQDKDEKASSGVPRAAATLGSAGAEAVRRAIHDVIDAQRLIKDRAHRYEVSIVIRLAETVAKGAGQEVVARSLKRFARAIRAGLFDRTR